MNNNCTDNHGHSKLTLAILPTPAKALATCIIVSLGIGMIGALGQIIVHDIIPTFKASPTHAGDTVSDAHNTATKDQVIAKRSSVERGDLFAELATSGKKVRQPFYEREQFVWVLKWSHIHLFGMSMIFILLGFVTIWLDSSLKLRIWLVVLPFIGILVDILAMWLKAFVSPVFFWMHMPGGGLFTIVFGYVSLRAIWEMWIEPSRSR
jgi:hypothetical protein